MAVGRPTERGLGLVVMVWLSLPLLFPAVVKAERLPIKTYTTADGLARDHIIRIVRDSRGFLWFCTIEGLSRFDGYRFTNYTTDHGLPHRTIADLLETRSGVYWVATGGGLCRFNPAPSASQPMFFTLSPNENPRAQFVNKLLEDRRGAIWCGTDDGLYRLEQTNGRWTFQSVPIGLPKNVPDDTQVNALLEDRPGTLWIVAGSGLYRRWPDGRSERYTTQHGLPHNHIQALLEDNQGRLWAGSRLGGLAQLVPAPDPNRRVVASVFTAKDGLANSLVECLLQSSDGKYWVGGVGLSEFIPTARDGQRFRRVTPAHGLSDLGLTALAEDGDGNLWIGSESGGAMKMARSGFTTYSEADGLASNRIAALVENQAGELCVISGALIISRFDGRRTTAVKPRSLAKLGWGWYQIAFQDRANEWWMATGGGVYRFPPVGRVEQLAQVRPKAIYTTRDGLTADEVFRLFEDSRGDIWISTISPDRDVLTRWERATETFHRYSPADGIPRSAPTAFCQDRSGNLWIGFYTGGLARYRDGRFKFFKNEDGVPEGFIRGLHLDHKGRLWIATGRGGLGRLDDPGADQPRFVRYTTAQGLASNDARCVTEDGQGHIYLGTGRGVDRLDPETGRIRHYTVDDGLANSELNVAFRDRHGALWFGTLRGLSRFLPEPDRPQSPPPVLIGGLRIAGIQRPVSELGQTEMSGFDLAPNEKNLQIDFFGISFGVGETLRYQHKLEGTDQDWSLPTDQRTINYANLSPGTYRFLVRAVNAEGQASPTPAVVSFRILPPLWQRWWFLTLAATGLGAGVYALYRYRLAQMIALERVRTRIATDLHDDIGASLSQIAILSEVVRQQVDSQNPRVTEPLAQIAGVSRELVDAMSDIVWAINPKRDTLGDLVHRMRRFASDVFTARNIRFQFRAPDEGPPIKMGADRRRQVYLVFKESVNNVVRHSGCTEAEIEFKVEGGWLVLRARDNGRGFDPAHVSDGHGLMSMTARAKTLGGALEFLSQEGQGTTVVLRAPLK